MKKGQTSMLGNIFLIFMLIVFFMLLYVYGSSFGTMSSTGFNIIPTNEKFMDKYSLIPSDKVAIYQGSTLPDVPFNPIKFDEDDSLPSVDGKDKGKKAMFMMAYNKCDPSCCPSTYSCSGGCVCMTKEQQDFIGTRGKNNKSTKCSGISEY